MKNSRYDVVVIGAGPSGSICARNLARRGYHVLLCEKRPVVGVPVRCGEATGPQKRLADFMPVNPDYLETSITGVILHGPGGIDIRYDANKELGVMLDRKLFDQDLAHQAEREGAELCVDARISAVGPAQNGARSVTIEYGGQSHAVEAAMVVGADGAEALSGRWVGLKTRQLPPYTCTAIELRIKAEDANPHHLTFWQGYDSINRGYIWVFPKVKSKVVNLGSGELMPKLGAKNMYDLSLEYKNKLFPDAVVEEVHGGCVPVSGNLTDYVADRFLLSGDAAHHTNPLTGGGIMASIVAADTAARWIDAGFKAGDLSPAFLRQYQQECWDRFGRNHRKEARIRDFVLGLPPAHQTAFYGIFRGMVNRGFTLPARALGFAQLGLLAARNPKLTKKAFFRA